MCSSEPVRKKARSTTGASFVPLASSPAVNVSGTADQTPTRAHKSRKFKNESSTRTTTVHECGFFKPHISGITALDVNPTGKMLVLSRMDLTIELYYQYLHHWTQIAVVFPPSGEADLSVSSLRFSTCGKYIFASRFDGSLSIYIVSTEGLIPHVTIQPGGGAIWDVALAPDFKTENFCLALACDDGRVRLVSPDPEFSSLKNEILPDESSHYIIKCGQYTSGRMLCVSWTQGLFNEEGKGIIVCGDSEGNVRWIRSGDMRTLGSGRIPKHKNASIPIWTVQMFGAQNNVVCGDDRGQVTIWSSETYTLKAEVSIEGFIGSIWCSALHEFEDQRFTLLFGCANGSVGGLRFSSASSDQWSILRARPLHTHDVRGVCFFANGRFISGSVDSRLASSTTNYFVTSRDMVYYPPILGCAVRQSSFHVLSKHDIVICRRSREIEFWFIPEDKDHPPRQVLRMKLSVASDLRASAVSDDCRYLFASDAESVRLYQLFEESSNEGKPLPLGKIQAIDVQPKAESVLHGCADVVFHYTTLAAITRCRTTVAFYNITSGELKVFPISKLSSTARFLTKISTGGKIVAVSDSLGQVFTTQFRNASDFESIHWRIQETCLERGKLISALSVSATGGKLALSSITGEIVYTKVHGTNRHGAVRLQLPSVPNSISVANLEKSLLVSTLNQAKVLCVRGRKRKDRVLKIEFQSQDLPHRGTLWSSGVLTGGRAVIIRRRQEVIESTLPDAIPKKQYGG